MFEPKLHLTLEPFDTERSAQVVRLDGEFDKLGLASVREQLDMVTQKFIGKRLIFDLTNLIFINSEGIGYLIGTYTHIANIGGTFYIAGAKAHVQDVFEALGLWNIVKHADSVDACYSL